MKNVDECLFLTLEKGREILKITKRLFLLLFIGVIIGGPFLVYDVFYGNPIRSLIMENETKKPSQAWI